MKNEEVNYDEYLNADGDCICPICGQVTDQEMLWVRNGIVACDVCVGDGEAPRAYYNGPFEKDADNE